MKSINIRRHSTLFSINRVSHDSPKKISPSCRSAIQCKALDINVAESDTQIAIAGVMLGAIVGIGAPIFYASRDEADEKRLKEIRALNKATKEATGEYMNEKEIYAIRPPRWTDRREFLDDD